MLRGVFPVIPTFFDESDKVAPDDVRSTVRFALDAGAHGVVFPGVASEVNFLSLEERGQLMSVVRDEVDSQVPIIGGASAATSGEAISAGRQALENGIDHLMIMAPACLGQELTAHAEFFAEIHEHLPEAKILLQNAPTPIGAGLAAKDVATLAAGCPGVCYIKEETLPSGPAISALLAIDVPQLLGVFGGGGARFLIDELHRGAIGALPAVELTDLHVAIYATYQSGNLELARKLYRLSLPLLVAQMNYRMRLTKYVLQRRGVTRYLATRAPLPELDAAAMRDIDELLADLKADFP